MTEDWQQGGFGLYIHWPFCEAKCPYCDFNSHVSRSIDQAAWRDAYLVELARAASETKGRVLNAVFFGGGTPSLMDPDTVADIISAIRSHWPTSNDLEITLEANPSSVEAGRFAAFRQAGVNRVSMGIQALNDMDLKRLGRLHNTNEALAAFDIARAHFERVSFDLIYGRQNQTSDDWKKELKQALTLAIDHVSLYQLTIENGTAFGDRYARGKLNGLPSEDLGADMFQLTQEVCDLHGMPAYEVSNHARDGAQSRHNLIYWRYGDYIGIGPGAHGRLTLAGQKFATECYSNPNRWLTGVAKQETERPRERLSTTEQATEFLLMGLRVKEGISLSRYEKISGAPLSKDALDHLSDIGMIEVTGDRLVVKNQGVMVLNAVIEALIPH
ncbi:radical SAM family heme chaperone HemW [Sulfitobacter geojensis]|uniref:Heme chaperone HemW n=1 Tax=Sulfitobacter geojensis TaxID=1342299 RepID=A0AAE3B6Q1_9RHOB|nr:radical SAM family heme chaperone HemW [Sulfitobacter geojensis]MBM1689404.1 coproporphyrinogen III oxidase [Sulfitobacter geojensis]MBM1693470.1 coproporphyrinogen III oxidase [Sulfitobacter geojensis]MBM1705636.1 coproporphyrinogen III oxidase [Sulfitobacter geojensis]MBM1709694.1 coproporphyrinogen III oxidase [Sulfitobacter geojensis]MBM1713760.1 coproporphyrinogen III oxidase [Sulfitobacter geojensis]